MLGERLISPLGLFCHSMMGDLVLIEDDRIRFAETCLDRQISWVSAADGKTSSVFAFCTLMLGTIAALAPEPQGWSCIAVTVSLLAASFLIISLLFLAVATFPKTSGPTGSLVFFKGISDRKPSDFIATFNEVSTEEFLNDLLNQCHRNAEIASAKYSWVKRAMVMMYCSVPPWIASIYLLYQLKKG